MNPWWGPPGDLEEDEHGYDAWFDLWVDERGTVRSHLGLNECQLSLEDVRAALASGLHELLAGRSKRLPTRRNPGAELDLEQPVLLVRVVHQRNGEVECGWGALAADEHLLRPLGELAAVALRELPGTRAG